MEELLESFMARQDENTKKQEDANMKRDAAIRNLENQMGQLAKHMAERDSG